MGLDGQCNSFLLRGLGAGRPVAQAAKVKRPALGSRRALRSRQSPLEFLSPYPSAPPPPHTRALKSSKKKITRLKYYEKKEEEEEERAGG